jgi:hypothetical protein
MCSKDNMGSVLLIFAIGASALNHGTNKPSEVAGLTEHDQ